MTPFPISNGLNDDEQNFLHDSLRNECSYEGLQLFAPHNTTSQFIDLVEEISSDASTPTPLLNERFIDVLRNMQLTEEELKANGLKMLYSFPRWTDDQKCIVAVEPSIFDVINGRSEFVPDNDTRRKCVRCHAPYRLPTDGKKKIDFCIHHTKPATKGMLFHPCCGKAAGLAGCSYSNNHVTDTMKESNLRRFWATPDPIGPCDPRSDACYAMDCEFVYTTWGKEPARVTVVDMVGNEVVDCVFRTEHELVDPNTQYSGLTAEQIESSDITLDYVRGLLFDLINSETILIGHALENDLKALRIVHDVVIDTSVLYSHSTVGRRYFKRSLKSLAREELGIDIQTGNGGHDSGEDAWAAMQLVMKMIDSYESY